MEDAWNKLSDSSLYRLYITFLVVAWILSQINLINYLDKLTYFMLIIYSDNEAEV